ncbi:MAG: ABC transporter substrate-binding protein [Petrotogales bacterium]
MKKSIILVLLVMFLLVSAFGAQKGPVTVASKIDTEGALLGQMIVLMLRDSGFEVTDKTEFGTTPIIRQSIIAGEIDIYPEYTGNGGFFFDNIDPIIWKNGELGYEVVKYLDREKNGLVWLKPASANNTWAISTRKDLAEKENIYTLENFAEYVNEGGKVKLACSEEFVNREDALPAFQNAYGFTLKDNQLLTFSGGNTAQTERAAALGTDGVNFAMAYGTDGALSSLGLIVLEDTKNVQPVYRPAPLVREEIYLNYPEIGEILKPVFESLSLETLQTLNAKIAIQGLPASEVASDYLKENGFLK